MARSGKKSGSRATGSKRPVSGKRELAGAKPKRTAVLRTGSDDQKQISPAKDVDSPPNFPVIAIGASAGGMEAASALLRQLRPARELAVVYIQHLVRSHASLLPEILARETELEVRQAEDDMELRPGHLYVIPPNCSMTVKSGKLQLERRDESPVPLPIDIFFRSLAEDRKSAAIGVILSGTGSDGTLGIRAIKEGGGFTIAQDDTAKHASMPRSAIKSGFVDMVLPPEQIAMELMRLVNDAYVHAGEDGFRHRASDTEREALQRIFSAVKKAHGVDFSHYKESSTRRRIRRRMAMHRLQTLAEYSALMDQVPAEADLLFQDMLIRVTGFFRDKDVFRVLGDEILTDLLRSRKRPDSPLRLWVPGCATGEEVYSLAMLACETAQSLGIEPRVQIFGTDVSESGIATARAAIYPENIVEEVSPERLRTFFSKADGEYRVNRSVRDMCVFARQDMTKDPPFSKLDLISCRNVMIYLDPLLQRRVLSVFHYALKPGGHLVLGNSESVGQSSDLFDLIHRKQQIYRKKAGARRPALEFAPMEARDQVDVPATGQRPGHSGELSLLKEADRVVLSHYAPAGVLVNEDLDILQFRGRTSNYLEPPPGSPSFNLLKMAREGLLAELRNGLVQVKKSQRPVRRPGVKVRTNGESIEVDLDIFPIQTSDHERHYLILFHEAVDVPQPRGKKNAATVARRPGPATAEEKRDILRLKGELEATREYLQSIIEEQEAMNEELRSANEEIQSSNEELQSTNEELETAKEELQSSNEELTTLNEELENRNSELDRLNNDLVNLLASIDIPIVMLGNDLRIRRFSPAAQNFFNLIPADIGRPVTDMRSTLKLDDLEQIITGVIESLKMREIPVGKGKNQVMRIRPYRTLDNRIDGAVLTLIRMPEQE